MKKVVKEIGSGDSAIDKTIKEMWRLINEDAKDSVVVSKAKSLSSNDQLQTIKNVFNYTVDNFKYKSDPPGIEHFTRPKYLITKEFDKYLDCDDMVGILAALLLANKIPVQIKVIAWRRQEYTHVILLAKYQNMWIPLDAVQGKSGFGNQIRKVFREKIYKNPMGQLVTLEDGCCGGNSEPRSPRGGNRGDNTNNNVIMIGNSAEQYEMVKKHDFAAPQAILKNNREVSAPEIKEVIREVEKKVPVPFPVIKKVRIKQPVRTVAKQPVVNYREFY